MPVVARAEAIAAEVGVPAAASDRPFMIVLVARFNQFERI